MKNHRLRMLQTALGVLRGEMDALAEWVKADLDPSPPDDVLHFLGNADTTALFAGLDDALGIYLAARNDYADREDMNLVALTLDYSQDTFLEIAEAEEKAQK